MWPNFAAAQALPPATHGLEDPSEIACTIQLAPSELQNQALLSACMQGYQQANPTWCDQQANFTPEQKNACKKGTNEKHPPESLYCGSKFSAPSVGQLYNNKNEYFACSGGFKLGEAYCAQNYAGQQKLIDACEKGSNAVEAYDVARAHGSGTPAAAPATPPLGVAPDKSSITKMLVDPADVNKRQTCSLEGVMGEMVCGGINITANMADGALAMLGSFMKVDALTTQPDNPVYRYWKDFRTVANVLFVIALLAIVFSQITGVGLSAYSLMKMMPRLVVGAVLLNASYLVCTVIIDASNVLGATVYSTMRDVVAPKPVRLSTQTEDRLQAPMTANPIIDPATNEPETFGSVANSLAFAHSVSVVRGGKGVTPSGVVNGGKLAGKAMNSALTALLPVIVVVLLGIVITVVCLLLRQALIIGFVIIAPLAIAAFLLPNTKSLFDRWLKTFIPLVMLFPVVAFVFGMGAIASQILAAGAFSNANIAVRGLLLLMALSVQIIPLIAVPKLMAFGGGLLAQLTNMAAGRTAGLNNKAKQHAQKQREIKDNLALSDPHWYNKLGRMRANSKIKDKQSEELLEQAQDRYSKPGQAAYAGATDSVGGAATSSSPVDSTTDPTSNPVAGVPINPESSPTPADPAAPETNEESAGPDPAVPNTADSTEPPVEPSGPPPPDDRPEPEDDEEDLSDFTREVYLQGKGRARLVEAKAEQLATAVAYDADIEAMALGAVPGTTAIDQEGAILRIGKNKNIGGMLALTKGSSTMSRSARNTLADSMMSSSFSGGAPMFANQEVQDNVRRGLVNSETFAATVIAPSLRVDDFSPQDITALDDEVGKEINKVLASPEQYGLSPERVQDIRDAAGRALDSEGTRRTVAKPLRTIEEMAGRPPGGLS
jgi:hypothetical protein